MLVYGKQCAKTSFIEAMGQKDKIVSKARINHKSRVALAHSPTLDSSEREQ